MRIRQRMRILSDHRESKDSSPATLFDRIFHSLQRIRRKFRPLFSKTSALFHFP